MCTFKTLFLALLLAFFGNMENADSLCLQCNAEAQSATQMQDKPESLIEKRFLDVKESDPQGKAHQLSKYAGKGKWVFVDFWASWCSHCRAEMPNVVAVYKKYHNKGLEIVGFSFDVDIDDWKEAIKSLAMPWIHLSDLKGWQSEAGQVYGIHAIPDNLLINPDGIIVAHDLRGVELDQQLSVIFQ
ncbi:MAG: TlpA family protein disulfide reductase [Bacteroidales bacterium]|nr:TlpA family protein disulfide reductase [Bacteroidales bacterium]